MPVLRLWTGAKLPALKSAIGSIIKEEGVPNKVKAIGDDLPECEAGDVILGFGVKALKVLQKKGLVSKNKSLGSLREKPIPVANGKAFVLLTYDPAFVEKDYARKQEVEWDTRLAARLLKYKTDKPILGEYRYVTDFKDAVDYVVAENEKTGKPVVITVDLETMGLVPFLPDKQIVSISITYKEGTADVLPTYPVFDSKVLKQIEWLLSTDKVTTRGANFKFDRLWMLEKWGIECTNFKMDTTLVGSLLDENRNNSLNMHTKVYAPELGGYDNSFNTKYDKSQMEKVLEEAPDDFLTYAGGDTDACYRVSEAMKKELLADKRLTNFYTRLLHPSSHAFLMAEKRGMVVDIEEYQRLRTQVVATIEELEAKAFSMMPRRLRIKYADNLKLTRDVILRDYLFSDLGLGLKPKMFTPKPDKYGNPRPSCAIEHLEMFSDVPEASEFVEILREYNSAKKTLSTYIDGFMKHLRPDGRFHPTYMLHRGEFHGDDAGTVTGRTSAKDPAFQCLVGESEILTNDGIKRIDWLVENNGAGLQVLTHTGKWRDIVGVYDNGVQPVFDVLLTSGNKVRCTGNHPFLTEGGWVKAEDLVKGDICYVIRTSNPEVYKSDLLQLGGDEESLFEPNEQGLGEVRGAWDQSLQTMVGIQELPRGYGGEAGERVVNRENRCKRGLRTGELSMGDPNGAVLESKDNGVDNVQGKDPNNESMGEGVQYKSRSLEVPTRYRAINGGSFDEDEEADWNTFKEERVVSVTPVGHYHTYDLTIDKSHSFVANGVVVHNTIPKHTKWAKPLRRVYVAPPGYVVLNADYSQGELRVAACVANEKNMIKAYRSGLDMHLLTGLRLYNLQHPEDQLSLSEALELMEKNDPRVKVARQGGKAGNFGLLYGMQAPGFMEYARKQYGVVMTLEEATRFRNEFFELYPGLLDWHEEYRQYARSWGYVRSPLGRIRHLPQIHSKDQEIRSKQERQAINSPIQSTLSDLTQLAMVKLAQMYPDLWVFGMTHDSISAYVPEDEVEVWAMRIKSVMENLPLEEEFWWSPQLTFLADIEVGPNLADTEELKLAV